MSIRAQQDRIETVLESLPFITAFKHVAECDGLHCYSVHTAPDDNVDERIFHAVVQNGWSLTELQRKTINLEEVFVDLTTSEAT